MQIQISMMPCCVMMDKLMKEGIFAPQFFGKSGIDVIYIFKGLPINFCPICGVELMYDEIFKKEDE